ncbi:MAG: peptidylprolyl isomerase [Oscillospiraceae bacterium]|nr:peptidylprolyl isomerase [Oscillospiraceae bacterium]
MNETSDQNQNGQNTDEQLGHPGAKHGSSKMRNWIIGGLALVFIIAVVAVVVWIGVRQAPVSDPVVINMKPTNVTLSEAAVYYNSMLDDYAQEGYDTTDPDVLSEIKTGALTALAQRKIADLKIEELQLGTISEEDQLKAQQDAETEFENAIVMYAPFFQNEDGTLTDAELRAAVEEYFNEQQITLENVKQYYLSDMPTQKLLESIYADVTISNEDIAADYLARVAEQKESYENDVLNYEVEREYYGTDMVYMPPGYRGVRQILLAAPEDLQAKLDTLQSELSVLQEEFFNLNGGAALNSGVVTDPAVLHAPTPDPAAVAAKSDEIDAKAAEIEETRAGIPAALEERIQEIRDKLESGSTFAELIEQYGADPGMTEEPAKSAGYPVHEQSIIYDEAFKNGAMALENIGDVSEPILSSFGVHIIEYTRDIPEGAIEQTEASKAAFRDEVLINKQNAAIDAQFDIWTKEYEVVLHPELLQ